MFCSGQHGRYHQKTLSRTYAPFTAQLSYLFSSQVQLMHQKCSPALRAQVSEDMHVAPEPQQSQRSAPTALAPAPAPQAEPSGPENLPEHAAAAAAADDDDAVESHSLSQDDITLDGASGHSLGGHQGPLNTHDSLAYADSGTNPLVDGLHDHADDHLGDVRMFDAHDGGDGGICGDALGGSSFLETLEERERRRLAQNREAARRSRQRKKSRRALLLSTLQCTMTRTHDPVVS